MTMSATIAAIATKKGEVSVCLHVSSNDDRSAAREVDAEREIKHD